MASDDDAASVGEPMMYTYKQAAGKLGISISLLYRLMNAGEIKALKLAPQVRRITQAELDAYVGRKVAEQHPDSPAA